MDLFDRDWSTNLTTFWFKGFLFINMLLHDLRVPSQLRYNIMTARHLFRLNKIRFWDFFGKKKNFKIGNEVKK